MKSASPDTGLFRATVKTNTKLNDSNFILAFSIAPGAGFREPAAGQFFMFGVKNCGKDPLLKRPFCYFRKRGGAIEILYRVVGKMTSIMKGLRPGDEVEILGPLGNVYPVEEAECGKKLPLVIAGGVGIASVYPLLERLKGRAILFYGGRNGKEILLRKELRELSKKLVVATDDGSLGSRGTAVDAAKNFLNGKNREDFVLYACGPNGMLKAANGLGIEGYIASEEKMACGIGVCLGCAVKTKDGYKRACKDGPVFRTGEIIF